MLLGRYELDNEVSQNKEEWVKIRDVAELVPDIFSDDSDDPGFNERLAAARRWADERRGINDIDKYGERRESESYESAEIKRLHRLATKKKNNSKLTLIQLAIVFMLTGGLVVLAFQYSPESKSEVDCAKPAAQAVNWSGCNLTGVELPKAKLIAANLMNINLQTANLRKANLTLANLKYSQLHLANLKYVNFEKANLTAANLMGANLSGASFHKANLSYANFREAIILTTDFSGARLDHAIWVDGRTCKPDSIGVCN